jgi:hypothetical protein
MIVVPISSRVLLCQVRKATALRTSNLDVKFWRLGYVVGVVTFVSGILMLSCVSRRHDFRVLGSRLTDLYARLDIYGPVEASILKAEDQK